ncbi:hypothetical protein F5877DRAFT_66476 [Lentinula edodes]|nr:hypothetical protein F5877DRAFT_66476 [Lentinula edodes]
MNGFKATHNRNEMLTLNTLGKGKRPTDMECILDICYLRKWFFSQFLQIPSKRNLKTTNIFNSPAMVDLERAMLSTSPEDSPGIDMSAIFAPFFWGFFVSIFLGGITIVQAYMYFPHPTDRKSVQVLAASMLILDLISSALVAQSLYYYLVSSFSLELLDQELTMTARQIPHFGSTAPLKTITPELSAECLISGILTFTYAYHLSMYRHHDVPWLIDFIGSSQMYFVYQIHSVKRTGILAWTILGVLTLFAVITFALNTSIILVGGIGCVATMYIFFGLAKGFGAVTDIMATIAMCTYLSNAKTGFSTHTDSLIKGLIQYIIERGAVVTLIQTLLLITFFAFPNNLYWLAFHINVTKLYANTFFCMFVDSVSVHMQGVI